jgi:hypothetical protein
VRNHPIQPGLAVIPALLSLGLGAAFAETPTSQTQNLPATTQVERSPGGYPAGSGNAGMPGWGTAPGPSTELPPHTASQPAMTDRANGGSGFGAGHPTSGLSDPSYSRVPSTPFSFTPQDTASGWRPEPSPATGYPGSTAGTGQSISGIPDVFSPERTEAAAGRPPAALSGWGPGSSWSGATGAPLMPGSPGYTPGSGQSSAGAMVPASPDLTGNWRGSGGEFVEIRGNFARIWGGESKYCNCIFMLYGNRLIAYSPDTDVVRKFEFSGNRNYFMLRDDRGQMMTFQRTE